MSEKDAGLIAKFKVERLTLSSRGIDHADCRYFVLDPEHDPIAEKALRSYAEEARREGFGALADDLIEWIGACPFYGNRPHEPHGWTDIGIAGEAWVECRGVPAPAPDDAEGKR